MDKGDNEKGAVNVSWFNLSDKQRLNILEETSARIGLPIFVIEKDWWVVHVLRLIRRMEISRHLVFKGGTSLSKAWGIIDRFSEDIDLAINREYFGFLGKISRTQVGKLKDASNHFISNDFLFSLKQLFLNENTEVKMEVIEKKDSDDDPVKIEIQYPSIVNYSQYIKPRVLLDIGSRSLMEPSSLCSFRSMIGDSFPTLSFADSFLKIRCVNPEKTFLEKLFLLHEEHQRPIEKMKIKGKSRHFYDIYKILQTPYASKALSDKELYRSIVEHRLRFTKLSGVDYTSHYPPRLNPIPPKELMSEWEKDYNEIRQQMILDNMPISFEELIEIIKALTSRINSVHLD